MDITRNRILVTLVLSLSCLAAQSAPQTVSDPGSDFTITYDDESTGLFGTPMLRNNTIFFVPSDFFAESLNGEGQALTRSTAQLTLTAVTPGFSFDNFNLFERGDYLLDGTGAEVSVNGQISVFDPNDPFSYADEFFSAGNLTINDGELHNWTASAAIDAASGWAAGSREVQLTLENMLRAITTDPGTAAFVEKKFSGVVAISVNNSPVPVPAALWLFGSALLGLIGMRRRS